MKAPKEKTLRRMNIVKGQVEGIMRMIEEDRYCIDISNQLMAVIAALKGINRDVLSAHLHSCVLDSMRSDDKRDQERKMAEIEEVITKLAK